MHLAPALWIGIGAVVLAIGAILLFFRGSSSEGLGTPPRLERATERVEVYVDESGHSTQGSVFAMGAIAGTADQWSSFDSDWLGVMASAGFSEPFHAVEFEGLARSV